MMEITDDSSGWQAIEAAPRKTLAQLFDADPDRVKLFSRDLAGIHFDFSKTHLTAELVEQFGRLADQAGYAAKREALFSGAVVNGSEHRAATHVAERGQGAPADVDLASKRRARMRSLIDAVE